MVTVNGSIHFVFQVKARYMLRMTGVGFHTYFSSCLIAMIGPYMVSYIGVLITVAAFGVKSLIIPQASVTLALLCFLHIPAVCFYSAIMSYMSNICGLHA